MLQFDTKPNPLDPHHGLVFSSFVCLFQLLSQKPDVHFVLKASFLEIYNEKVGLYNIFHALMSSSKLKKMVVSILAIPNF
jgi:hypothetical protein